MPILLLTGCWALFWNVGSACDHEETVSGELRVLDEDRRVTVQSVWVDAESSGECVVAVSMNLDLGQGCSLSVDADGAGDTLQVYELDLHGEEGCGLDGGGWNPVSLDAAWIEVDAVLEETDSDRTYCLDGDVTLVVDVVLERDDETVAVVGDVTVSGVQSASAVPSSCD